MLSHSDESRLRELFSEALMLICRNTISFESQLTVKALIGLTIDGAEVPSIDCNNVLLKMEQTDKKLNVHTSGCVPKKFNVTSDGRKSNSDNVSSNRAKSDCSRQQNMSALFSDVEHLAKRYEHKVMQVENSSQGVITPTTNNFGNASTSTIRSAEHTYATHAGEEYDDDEVEPTETESGLVELHETDQASEVFLSSNSNQEWRSTVEPQKVTGVSLSAFEDENKGMVQTVIVGGEGMLPGQVEYVGNEEEVLVMAGMETDEASTLQFMQPGETFEFNGTTYQIAAADDVTGELPNDSQTKEEKISVVKMKKGNHTKSKKPKKFLCSLCSHWFTSHWGLKIHERLHRGQFRYHCKICGKGFTSSVNVRGHMVKHSQQKEFSCEYCGKAFTYRQSLERHQAKKGDAPCSGLRGRGSRKPLAPKRGSNFVINLVPANESSMADFSERS